MKWMFTYLLAAIVGVVSATSVTDTLLIEEVVKVEHFSSEQTMQSPFTDLKYQQGRRLGEVLSECSSVYVKNYGNGQLASLAVRGTSASQTEIQWNGIKLNSPSLGQVDLSLFTIGMQDDVQLVRTGYGGVVGGTLKLLSEAKFDSSVGVRGLIRVGSFKTVETFGAVDYATNRVSGSTRISYLHSDNDFSYRNTFKEGAPYVKQSNAGVNLLSFMQQFNVAVNRNNELNFYLWLNDADRQIPPIMSKPESRQQQQDYSLRTMAVWKGGFKLLRLNFTSAYIEDKLRYKDVAAVLDETTLTSAIRNHFSAVYYFPFNLVLRGEVHEDVEMVNTPAYGVFKSRNDAGLKLYADYYFKNGLKLHGGLRQDVVGKQASAFSPELALDFKHTVKTWHTVEASAMVSRNFRFPTFNDLYWIPGGNAQLKQEQSVNGELGFKYRYGSLFEAALNGFAIYVNNWIQWAPQGSVWQATNFKRVFSRGVECNIHATNTNDITGSVFKVDGNVSYSFTKTTNLDATSQYDESKGKQLIYVPLHNLVAGVQLEYRRFYIRAGGNYNGLVYTSTDNVQSLPGWFVSDLEAGKDFVFGKNEIGLAFKVRNIGNAQYQCVAQYPMPGRSFEGVLRFKFAP